MPDLSPQSSRSSVSSSGSPQFSQDGSFGSSPSPCSPSILLNPLPPTTIKNGKRRLSVLITHQPSPPPAHFLAENPSYAFNASPPNAFPESRLRSSSARPPHSRHGSDSFIEDTASGQEECEEADEKCKNKLSFAPLPPGRRAYRSNSLTLGVAARAKMINSQGPTPSYNSSPRYGGPQQWYQTGGVTPADVYTIDDVKRGLGKLWTRVSKPRRGSTASSTSSADAQVMEQEGKGKSKEIEHIEECDEDDCDEAFIECQEDEEEPRGRSLGLVLDGGQDDSSLGSSASTGSLPQPHTPSDSLEDVVLDRKGKGVAGRATSTAVAL